MKLFDPKMELYQEGWKLEPISNGKWVASKILETNEGKGLVFVGDKDVWIYTQKFKPLESIEGLDQQELERRKFDLIKDRCVGLEWDYYFSYDEVKDFVKIMENVEKLNTR